MKVWKHTSIKLCKFASMQVGKIESMKVCKNRSIQLCMSAHVEVCTYICSVHIAQCSWIYKYKCILLSKYPNKSMQTGKYASIQDPSS